MGRFGGFETERVAREPEFFISHEQVDVKLSKFVSLENLLNSLEKFASTVTALDKKCAENHDICQNKVLSSEEALKKEILEIRNTFSKLFEGNRLDIATTVSLVRAQVISEIRKEIERLTDYMHEKCKALDEKIEAVNSDTTHGARLRDSRMGFQDADRGQ